MYNVKLNVYWPTPEGPRNVQISRAAASCYAALERCVSDLLRKVSMLKDPEYQETTCICLTGFILPIAAHDLDHARRVAKMHEKNDDDVAAASDVAELNAQLLDPSSPIYRAKQGG